MADGRGLVGGLEAAGDAHVPAVYPRQWPTRPPFQDVDVHRVNLELPRRSGQRKAFDDRLAAHLAADDFGLVGLCDRLVVLVLHVPQCEQAPVKLAVDRVRTQQICTGLGHTFVSLPSVCRRISKR